LQGTKIIEGLKVYNDLFAKFVDYRGLEIKVSELEKRLASEKTVKCIVVADSTPKKSKLTGKTWTKHTEFASKPHTQESKQLRVIQQCFPSKSATSNPLATSWRSQNFTVQTSFWRLGGHGKQARAHRLEHCCFRDAYDNSDLSVAFIGSSFRQTKLNLRRVAGFCPNLPKRTCHVQKTRISFENGSFIEAFPNNPRHHPRQHIPPRLVGRS
jgi:hypothetical protein